MELTTCKSPYFLFDSFSQNGYNYDHIERMGFMQTINATEAKKNFLKLIRNTDELFERYCITRNGKQTAVLMSIDDFEGWLETLEIMSSKKAVADIKKARKELDAGKGIPFSKVMSKHHAE